MENQNLSNQQNIVNEQAGPQTVPATPPVTPVSEVATSVPKSSLGVQPAGNGKKGMSRVMVASIVVLVIAVVVVVAGFFVYYKSGLFGQGNLNAQPATSMTTSGNVAVNPTPTPTPFVVNNQQDVQNALNAVQTQDPNSMTSTLNQNSTDASQFGQ